MKPKIIVFDKFLGYGVGGAQHSFHNLLENLKGNFKFLGCHVKKGFSANKYQLENWLIERIEIKECPWLPYFEYWLNRKTISKFIASQKGEILITQGLWGAIAVGAFLGKTIYFIRDEYHFNKIPIYQIGLKKFFKKIYLFSQYPFIKKIFFDNQKAIEKADLVIVNSYFVKKAIKEKFNKDSEVVYPLIKVRELHKIKLPSFKKRPFLTLIGSEFIKGREIIEKIAEKMPDHQFMVVGRLIKEPIKKGNILYHPWVKDPLDVYRKTRILLVASLIEEAFPRAPVEGAGLGIPSLASKKGGLPEFMPDFLLVENPWDIEKWIEKIEDIEQNYENYSKILKEKSLEFDFLEQIEKFKKILKEKFNIEL